MNHSWKCAARAATILTLAVAVGFPGAAFPAGQIFDSTTPQSIGVSTGADSPRATAPIDLEGYWVSVVNEDWRHRMFTARRGDYDLLRLNRAGRELADSWSPDEDRPSGEDGCLMAYGAAGIMRLPGRLHITWEDEKTLRVDLDAGTQTRRFYFDPSQAPTGGPARLGRSIAVWEFEGGPEGSSLEDAPRSGSLKVVTDNMIPGYYLKNGIPYSGDAHMTEFFVRISEPGTEYLLVQTFVYDPTYLTEPFVRTLTFKKEPDGAKWNPTSCSTYY